MWRNNAKKAADDAERELKAWRAATAKRAREVLKRLRKVHGITSAAVMPILEAEKRRQLKEARDSQQAAAIKLTKMLTGRQAARLLMKVKKGKRLPETVAALSRFVDMLERNINVERRGRKSAPARRALLPLVELFTARTGKPLRENAAELLEAAFPEYQRADARKSVYDDLKPSKPRARFEIPPLHAIADKPTRRAAAQLVINQARADLLDMRVEALPKPSKPQAAAVDGLSADCRAINCDKKKKAYEQIFGAGIGALAGVWMHSDEHGGLYFVCAKCCRVRHSGCDGMHGDLCRRCTT